MVINAKMKATMEKSLKTKLLLTCLFVSIISLFTACEHYVDVDFVISKTNDNDTITFIGWNKAYQDGMTYYKIPFVTNNGEQMICATICSFSVGGGPNVCVSREQAFVRLMSDFDSVRIVRHSDGASTITYRHDDSATDSQRFFFKPEAWMCNPDDEGFEGSRTYKLKLTEEMFE